MIDELCRVLKPGGRLVLGTPDYARWEWVYLEKLYARVAPGAYADEHIAHYTRKELIGLLENKGLAHEATRYIARGELIMAFRRPLKSLSQTDLTGRDSASEPGGKELFGTQSRATIRSE